MSENNPNFQRTLVAYFEQEFIEFDTGKDGPHCERKLWAAVLSAGIAGCVTGDHFEISWVRRRTFEVGSFDWICDEALNISWKEKLRKVCLKAADKYSNHSDFLKDCYARSRKGQRKARVPRAKLKKTFRRAD